MKKTHGKVIGREYNDYECEIDGQVNLLIHENAFNFEPEIGDPVIIHWDPLTSTVFEVTEEE